MTLSKKSNRANVHFEVKSYTKSDHCEHCRSEKKPSSPDEGGLYFDLHRVYSVERCTNCRPAFLEAVSAIVPKSCVGCMHMIDTCLECGML